MAVDGVCGPLYVDTRSLGISREQGAPDKAINKSTKLRLLREFLQSSSSFPTGMSSKGRFRNGPESSAVTVQKEQRQTSGSLVPQMGS